MAGARQLDLSIYYRASYSQQKPKEFEVSGAKVMN